MLHILKASLQSFYSFQSYETAARKWKGIAACYLAVLSLICASSCHLKWHLFLSEIAHGAREVSHSIPGLSIRQGRFLVKSESPVILLGGSHKRPLLVIDTRPEKAMLGKGAPLVVRSQDIRVYGFNDKETTNVPKLTLPIENLFGKTNLDLDPDEIARVIERICLGLSIGIFSAILLFIFLASLLQALLWGYIALLLRRILGKDKPAYKPLVRAAALALTPSLAIRGATGLIGLDLPFVLDIAVVCVYFAYLLMAYAAIFHPRRQASVTSGLTEEAA